MYSVVFDAIARVTGDNPVWSALLDNRFTEQGCHTQTLHGAEEFFSLLLSNSLGSFLSTEPRPGWI